VYASLHRRGVRIVTRHNVVGLTDDGLECADIFTDEPLFLDCRSLVVVGMRRPRTDLYDALLAARPRWHGAGIRSVDRIGDALAPGAIMHAVYSGHLYARSLDMVANELPYRIDPGLLDKEGLLF
jgi:dimethylamine/trimethylamine dehydrogenase